MARTVSGTVFCSTFAIVTGTATGAALCAFRVEQPARPAMARPSVSVSDESVRALAKLFLSPVLVAIPVLRRMTVAIRFRGRQNAAQPDVCELRAHRCRVEALVHAAAKDLLHEVVVEEHPHESARGNQRVHAAECALLDAPLDVLRQDLVVRGHVRLEKAVCQAVVLESAEEQQARAGL